MKVTGQNTFLDQVLRDQQTLVWNLKLSRDSLLKEECREPCLIHGDWCLQNQNYFYVFQPVGLKKQFLSMHLSVTALSGWHIPIVGSLCWNLS